MHKDFQLQPWYDAHVQGEKKERKKRKKERKKSSLDMLYGARVNNILVTACVVKRMLSDTKSIDIAQNNC